MKTSRIYITLCALIACAATSAQDTALLPTRSNSAFENMKGNVASVTENTYQLQVRAFVHVFDGVRTEGKDTVSFGISSRWIFQFNEQGQQVERLILTPVGPISSAISSGLSLNGPNIVEVINGRTLDENSVSSRTLWFYDDHGQNSGCSVYSGTGGQDETMDFEQYYNQEYTDEGWLAKKSGSTYFRTGSRVDSILYSDGSMETWEYLDDNGSHRIRQTGEEFYYDDAHRLVRYVNSEGVELITQYNEHGDMIYNDEDRYPSVRSTRYDNYEYDEHGNWIYRTTSYKDDDGEWNLTLESFREIEYRTDSPESVNSNAVPAKSRD